MPNQVPDHPLRLDTKAGERICKFVHLLIDTENQKVLVNGKTDPSTLST